MIDQILTEEAKDDLMARGHASGFRYGRRGNSDGRCQRLPNSAVVAATDQITLRIAEIR